MQEDLQGEEKVTLAALAIDTYAEAYDSLSTLADLGVPVPHVVLGRVRHQLVEFAQVWWATTHGDPIWHDDYLGVVEREAADWLASHSHVLRDLTEGTDGG